MINFWVALTLFLNANAVASHILRPAPVADIQFDKSARALQDRGLGQGSRKVAQEACGDYNFVFTGLPWNHPAIKASGFTPAQVEASIRADVKAIVNAGYNIKAVLVGPEDTLGDISSELKGVNWTGTGVGFGVRGNPSPVITRRLMDIIQLYRDEVPQARILFNYSPNSSLWAIQQYFPLPSSLDCQCGPGKDL
ncbi:uncharacterized protein GLRG_11967, partial [Colletotrichum graminicola M1.001]